MEEEIGYEHVFDLKKVDSVESDLVGINPMWEYRCKANKDHTYFVEIEGHITQSEMLDINVVCIKHGIAMEIPKGGKLHLLFEEVPSKHSKKELPFKPKVSDLLKGISITKTIKG